MANTISKNDDVIDSRDVIARIEELQSEHDDLTIGIESAANPIEEIGAREALAEWLNGEEGQELAALEKLAEEAEGYAEDWQYGAQLIRDSYFQDYAQELAEDIGAIDKAANWPNTCIDWESAAQELQQDYTAVDFDGVTYWVR
jgi:hypothetical protein